MYPKVCKAEKNQIWSLQQVDGSRSIQIKAMHGTTCIDGHPENPKVHMWPCEKANKHQRWRFNYKEGGQIKHHAHTAVTGSGITSVCLEAVDGNDAGGEVKLRACESENANQQWKLDAATGQLKVKSGLCLDALGHSTKGGMLQMYDCAAIKPKNVRKSTLVLGEENAAASKFLFRRRKPAMKKEAGESCRLNVECKSSICAGNGGSRFSGLTGKCSKDRLAVAAVKKVATKSVVKVTGAVLVAKLKEYGKFLPAEVRPMLEDIFKHMASGDIAGAKASFKRHGSELVRHLLPVTVMATLKTISSTPANLYQSMCHYMNAFNPNGFKSKAMATVEQVGQSEAGGYPSGILEFYYVQASTRWWNTTGLGQRGVGCMKAGQKWNKEWTLPGGGCNIPLDPSQGARCAAKVQVQLKKCNSCCCAMGRQNPIVTKVSSTLLYDANICGEWFTAADSFTRIAIGFFRSVQASGQYPKRCYGGYLGFQKYDDAKP